MAIELIKNDHLPDIFIDLRDANTGEPGDATTWEAVNISDPNTSVSVLWRQKGTTTVLATLGTTKVDGGVNGGVFMSWGTFLEDNEIGSYEGQIEVNFDGDIQTVVERLDVNLGEKFGVT